MVSHGVWQQGTVLVCPENDGQDVKGRDTNVSDQLYTYVFVLRDKSCWPRFACKIHVDAYNNVYLYSLVECDAKAPYHFNHVWA